MYIPSQWLFHIMKWFVVVRPLHIAMYRQQPPNKICSSNRAKKKKKRCIWRLQQIQATTNSWLLCNKMQKHCDIFTRDPHWHQRYSDIRNRRLNMNILIIVYNAYVILVIFFGYKLYLLWVIVALRCNKRHSIVLKHGCVMSLSDHRLLCLYSNRTAKLQPGHCENSVDAACMWLNNSHTVKDLFGRMRHGCDEGIHFEWETFCLYE